MTTPISESDVQTIPVTVRDGALYPEQPEEPIRTKRVNPPPDDHTCMICGRSSDVLVPFGGPGDPLVGDFSGAYLVKTFRWFLTLSPEESARIGMVEAACQGRDPADFESRAVEMFGIEQATLLLGRASIADQVDRSWECRDCILLDSWRAQWKRLVSNGWQPSQRDSLHNDLWDALDRYDVPMADVEILLQEALGAVRHFAAKNRAAAGSIGTLRHTYPDI